MRDARKKRKLKSFVLSLSGPVSKCKGSSQLTQQDGGGERDRGGGKGRGRRTARGGVGSGAERPNSSALPLDCEHVALTPGTSGLSLL